MPKQVPRYDLAVQRRAVEQVIQHQRPITVSGVNLESEASLITHLLPPRRRARKEKSPPSEYRSNSDEREDCAWAESVNAAS